MSTLASRIKQARKQAGLTQKDLAQRVGVSQPVISQLENGENLQSVHLLAIAKACGVDSDWLASGEEKPEQVVLTKEQLADLLREAFRNGAIQGERYHGWVDTDDFYTLRERAIQPLVHRSSGGHDDHGREVGGSPSSPERDSATLPDNLRSHRLSWLNAMERLIDLEPGGLDPTAEDLNGYWCHELQAMRDMYADLDRIDAMRAKGEEAQ